MRILNAAAALSGGLGLAMLAVAYHVLSGDPDVSFVYMAAGAQLAAACAGLAVAQRTGLLNAIAGWLIVGGALVFGASIYLGALHVHGLHMLAPVGGAAMIAGWLALAFAKPARA